MPQAAFRRPLRHAREHEGAAVLSHDTMTWWAFLCTVSAVNVAAWLASAAAVRRQCRSVPPELAVTVALQLLLSAGYVAGCAWRSVFPVYDIQRQVLVDSGLSSVLVGRSVATVAELCFAAQWALLAAGTARLTGSRFGRRVSRAIVPMIVVAEICSWHAVLTTANLGHVIEESLWGAAAALMVAAGLAQWSASSRAWKPFLAAWITAGLAYVAYMFGVDVPMYWARWLADESMGRPYLSLSQGLSDAAGRWVVTHRWEDWRSEVAWMSMYFSVAVWLSIATVHAAVRLRPVPAQPS